MFMCLRTEFNLKKALSLGVFLVFFLQLLMFNSLDVFADEGSTRAVEALIKPAFEDKLSIIEARSMDSTESLIKNKKNTIKYVLKKKGQNVPGFQSLEANGKVVYDQKPYFVIRSHSGGFKWTNFEQSEIFNGSFISAGYYRDYSFRPYKFANYSDAQGQIQYHTYPDRIFEENRLSYDGNNFNDMAEVFMEYPITFKSFQVYEGSKLAPVNKDTIRTGGVIIERENGSLLGFSFLESSKNSKVRIITEGKLLKLQHYVDIVSKFDRPNSKVKILNWGRGIFGAESYVNGKSSVLERIRQDVNPMRTEDFYVEKVSNNGNFDSQSVEQVKYDPITGIYTFMSEGISWGGSIKDAPYKYPSAKITAKPFDDRRIYLRHETNTPDTAGALQDENGYVLPVNLGITRSLGGGPIPDWTGSYTNLDPFCYEVWGKGWSRSEFPVNLKKGKNLTFRSLHAVHRWGLMQFAATGSVLSHKPLSTSNLGVWCSVDLSPWTADTGDIRGFSSTPTGYAWGEKIIGNEEQFAHALEFSYPSIGVNEKYLKEYKTELPNFSHFIQKNMYSTLNDKVDINYTIGSYPDRTQNRLLMDVEFKVKKDVRISGNDRLVLNRVHSNPVVFYNAFWKSNSNNSLSPQYISMPADINVASSNIQTIILEGSKPSAALSDKRWTFAPHEGNPQNMTGVEGNIFWEVLDQDITVGGKKVGNLPISLRIWKNKPNGYYNVPDGSLMPHGNYIYYDLSVEKENLDLKAGDSLKFSYIFMPYGGKTSNDEINSAQQTLNEFTFPKVTSVSSGTVQSKDYSWVPTVRSSDGNSAEFTVKGGDKILTVAVEGLKSYKNPNVYKKVNGSYQQINYSVNGRDGGTTYVDQKGTVGFALPIQMVPGTEITLKFEQHNTDNYGIVNLNNSNLGVNEEVQEIGKEIKPGVDVYANVEKGVYSISAKHSGKSLTVAFQDRYKDEGNVIQSRLSKSKRQQWLIEKIDKQNVKIMNIMTKKVLEVKDGSDNDGGKIQQSTWNGKDNQLWNIGDVGSGFVKIINKKSGKALDVSNVSKANGANVHQWNYWGGDNQKWKLKNLQTGSMIEVKESEWVSLVAKHSGKSIHIGELNKDSIKVHQWENIKSNLSLWKSYASS